MHKVNKRIEFIDICKALGIFLVVLGHVGSIDSINIWKASFYMPLFFLLSGLCFDETKYKSFLSFFKKRVLSLILPYLIFSVLLYLMWNGIAYIWFPSNIGTCLNLLNCLYMPASLTTCFGAVNWFLPALFIAELLFYLLCKLTKHSRKRVLIVMFIISIAAYIYPQLTNYRLPLALDSAIMGLSFYGIGWCLKKVNYDIIGKQIKKNMMLSNLILLFLLMFFAQLSFVNKQTNIRILVYGDYFLYMINAIGISFLFICLSMVIDNYSKRMKVFNLLKIVGKHTLVILLFNSVLASIYNMIISSHNIVIGNKLLYMLNNTAVSIVILVICVLISLFINKYLPFLLGKSKKN